MGEHFKSYSAVMPVIINKKESKTQILLLRRKDTGYEDDKWDMSGSGHVDEGETAKMAVVREAKEELGININIDDLSFAHLAHRVSSYGGRTYYDMYFLVEKFEGIPKIMEPNKASELKWFDLEDLPSDIMNIRKVVIDNIKNNIIYSELIEK